MDNDKKNLVSELKRFEKSMNAIGIQVKDPNNAVDSALEELDKYESTPWRPKTKLGEKLYNITLWDSNLRYYLLHPLKFVSQFFSEMKYAWQRAMRGWDERQTWSVDYHYSRIFSELIPYFKKVNGGVPFSILEQVAGKRVLMGEETEDEFKQASQLWDDVLNEIADGFAYYYDHQMNFYENEDYELIDKKLNRSLELLVKHFRDLWW